VPYLGAESLWFCRKINKDMATKKLKTQYFYDFVENGNEVIVPKYFNARYLYKSKDEVQREFLK
jgi:hypothetical protein